MSKKIKLPKAPKIRNLPALELWTNPLFKPKRTKDKERYTRKVKHKNA